MSNLKNEVKIHFVDSMSFGSYPENIDLSELLTKVENFINNRDSRDEYLSYKLVTVPVNSSSIEGHIVSVVNAYVTFQRKVLA